MVRRELRLDSFFVIWPIKMNKFKVFTFWFLSQFLEKTGCLLQSSSFAWSYLLQPAQSLTLVAFSFFDSEPFLGRFSFNLQHLRLLAFSGSAKTCKLAKDRRELFMELLDLSLLVLSFHFFVDPVADAPESLELNFHANVVLLGLNVFRVDFFVQSFDQLLGVLFLFRRCFDLIIDILESSFGFCMLPFELSKAFTEHKSFKFACV